MNIHFPVIYNTYYLIITCNLLRTYTFRQISKLCFSIDSILQSFHYGSDDKYWYLTEKSPPPAIFLSGLHYPLIPS